jgi:hypothetical protein
VPKIVVLGSCRFAPYTILAVPDPIPGAHNTEAGYEIAAAKFYPAIGECDEVWVNAPDGIGEHTGRDILYALGRGKPVFFVLPLRVDVLRRLSKAYASLLSRRILKPITRGVCKDESDQRDGLDP